MANKQCTKCKRTKSLEDDFHRKSESGSGRHPWCKACVSERNAAYYDANRQKIVEKERSRRAQRAVYIARRYR